MLGDTLPELLNACRREDATPLHLAIVASFKGAGGLEVRPLVQLDC